MDIKVYHIDRKKKKRNVSNMVTDISWSGDEETHHRTFELSLLNTIDVEKAKKLGIFALGTMLVFYKNDNELFRGFIFKKTHNSDGKVSLTAYDELIYAAKNYETILVKNETADQVIKKLCKKYGISIGTIHPTGYKIKKKLFENQSLSEIFRELLKLTSRKTKKHYKLFAKKGKVYLIAREKTTSNTIKVNDVISASREGSLEDIATQIKVVRGSLDKEKQKTTKSKEGSNKTKNKSKPYTTHTVKDKERIGYYGLIQKIEKADDDASVKEIKELAEKTLDKSKYVDMTWNMSFFGYAGCTTGHKITVHDDLSMVDGTYYISKDSHKFSNGEHTMDLQLSNRLV